MKKNIKTLVTFLFLSILITITPPLQSSLSTDTELNITICNDDDAPPEDAITKK